MPSSFNWIKVLLSLSRQKKLFGRSKFKKGFQLSFCKKVTGNYFSTLTQFLNVLDAYLNDFVFCIQRLATGSCNRDIHLWHPREGGTWHVDQRPLTSHSESVEDLQWSPNESNVCRKRYFFNLLGVSYFLAKELSILPT